MSKPGDLEIFERAAEARGRLLRVEAEREGAMPRVLALTFDVGRIVVSPESAGLSAVQANDRTDLPEDLVPLDEEEPWWRILGQPLTAVWPGDVQTAVGARRIGTARTLKLRFREESENPRVIVLEADAQALRVRLEG